VPQAIPILIAGIAAAAGPALAGASIGVILGSFAISAALTGVGMLLQSSQGGGSSLPLLPTLPSLDSGSRVTVRQPDAPKPLIYGETRVQGTIIFFNSREANRYLDVVVALAGHEVEEIGQLYFNDVPVALDGGGNVPGGTYAGLVHVEKKLGTTDQTAFDGLVAVSGQAWTVAHRGRGNALAWLSLQWNRSAFPNGLPNIWFVLKGRKLYDHRSETTAFSKNAALAVADYLADPVYGLGASYDLEIDLDVLDAGANVSDEDVTLASGATEKRYEANGILRSDIKRGDGIAALLSACGGKAIYAGGRWRIKPAAWEPPVIELDESDLRDGFTVQTLLGRRESFNAAKGKFSDPARLWQPADFPAITSAIYQAQDGGERVFKDLELPFTTSPTMAQRIAQIDLKRARQPLTMVWPCKLRGWLVTAGETVNVSYARLGWVSKPFDVVEATFVFGEAQEGKGSGGPPLIGVDLKLRETASAIYDSAALSAADPTPNTTLPDAFNVRPATNLTIAESLYSTRDGGGVKAKASLAWDASLDWFVQSGGSYRVEYKLSSASVWTVFADITATRFDIFDIDPGTYDFRVAAVNWAGRLADYATVMGRQIAGLSAPPSAPANLSISAIGGLAIARWDIPSDLDVLQGGFIVIRHSSLLTGAAWDTAVSIGEAMSANTMVAVLPLKSGTYLAKFRDASGVYSESATSFAQTQSSVHQFQTLAGGSLVEDPGFAGTKTNVVVVDSVLRLDDSGDFDSVPDVDAIVSWDWLGGVVSAGSYLCANRIDLGSVKRCRLTGTIESQVLNVFEQLDSRTGDVDDWPAWDGAMTGDEADARLMVRATQGDPNGMLPTWGPWQRLDSAEFSARGFDYPRLDMASTDDSFTIQISALAIVAEEVV